MASIANSVTIAGAAEPVFDLVTSARFWPQWHPASLAVGGVTQRPFQLGDVIHERGQVANIPFQVTWRVVEHERPSRIVLQSETPPARISYSFQARDKLTEFRRELQFDAGVFRSKVADPVELDRLMHGQSEQALRQLKELVERILREEAAGLQ